ncbi:hypothetical protein [Actinomadura flavalba]|uniref:hypothetical protein n=1 Tax=Actinomadura flavalba TaxID=1120938 RepID=UPI00037A9527|nr:hypothetical protein [Actinomadura flavalba]
MASQIEIRAAGTPEQVVPLLTETVEADGFRVTWESPGSGLIEKGSALKAMLLGAFGTHYKYRVLVHPQQDGGTVLNIALATTGMSGGAVGVTKVQRKLTDLQNRLNTAFGSTGAVAGS